jgi:hypothetical protein
MNRHYDRYLVKKYAPMFRDRHADMRTTLMCWGFEVGDGWFNIINTLCGIMCSEWLYAKEQYDHLKDRVGKQKYDFDLNHSYNTIVTEQDVAEAKEKMDKEAEKIPVVVQVKEKYGGLRFYVNAATEEQWAYIAFAEAMSYHTCEICGDKGKASRGGWIQTRCKEHEDD